MRPTIVALVILLVAINYGLCANLFKGLYFSKTATIYVDYLRYFFRTIDILSIGNCAKLCHSVTSCVFGRYQRRGHICHLTHALGGRINWLRFRPSPKLISWTRAMIDQVFTVENSPCRNISSDRSYKENYVTGTCSSYACGKPWITSNFSRSGNVFTTNGKVIIRTSCYNHEIDSFQPAYSMACTDATQWETIDDKASCTYSESIVIDDVAFTYKIVNIRVNQSTALRNCKLDNANLTTIFSLQKLEFYRGILASSKEDYWIDVKRIKLTEWRTSYGFLQPMGYDIWRSYKDVGLNCARMRRSMDYKLNDQHCTEMKYSYICERRYDGL